MENILREDLDYILDATMDLWEEIRGKRIFITGGTGFFGCWLLESFLWANERLGLNATVTVLTRSPEAFQRKTPHLAFNPAVQLYAGDVKSFEFPGKEFSHIIHASNEAADYFGKKDSPELVADAIAQAASHTLEFARHCGTPTFLFTSSGSVYGQQPPDMLLIPEDYGGILNTSDFRLAHGKGKLAAESLCARYAGQYGIPAKIARCFAFVGPYMPLDVHFAAGNFIRDALRGGPIIVRGDGNPHRSYLYAADLAICLWTILFKGKVCYPYNVGSDAAVTVESLAREVASVIDPGIKVIIEKRCSAATRADRYVPSTKRIHDELGIGQGIDLREAIRRTAAWYSRAIGKC